MKTYLPQRLIKSRGSLSQIEAAKKIGVMAQQLYKWEKGVVAPSLDMFVKICKVYDVSADWLLGITENPGRDIDQSSGNSIDADERAFLHKEVDRLHEELRMVHENHRMEIDRQKQEAKTRKRLTYAALVASGVRISPSIQAIFDDD